MCVCVLRKCAHSLWYCVIVTFSLMQSIRSDDQIFII